MPNKHYHTDPEKKPYGFVPLVDSVNYKAIVGHHKLEDNRLYGSLELVFQAKAPIHVASGLIVHQDDLKRYTNTDLELKADDPMLILSHFRTSQTRAIPGTSLKGAVRSLVEAITYSCLTHIDMKKVSPEAQKNDTHLKTLSRTCQIAQDQTNLHQLCPACSLFGTLGYMGRVNFHDAPQITGKGYIARRPIAHSPQPNQSQSNKHRTQAILYYENDKRAHYRTHTRKKLRGRKFYFHGQQPRDMRGKYEAIEVCEKGSEFKTQVVIEGLSYLELGLLLTGVGFFGPERAGGRFFHPFELKIGGSKPFGYGSLYLENIEISLTSQISDLYCAYDSSSGQLKENEKRLLIEKSLKALLKAKKLIQPQAWEQLVKLMNKDLVSINGIY